MMRKIFCLLAMVFQIMIVNAFEGKAEIDGINYYIITKGGVAEVVSREAGYSGDIVIPETIEYEGVKCTVTSIANNAFWMDRNLTSVSIPKTVSKIGISAFEDCSSLKTINIPSSVKTIASRAFYDCEGLETVITDNLKSWCEMEIGDDANPLPYTQDFIIAGNRVCDLIIPNTIHTICDRAFHGYKGLRTVTFENGVNLIGDYAFFDCVELTTVTIPNSVVKIGNSAFYGCSALNELTLSEGLTEIGWYSFKGCSSLSHVSIPNSVTLIDNNAFENCKELKSINIGNGLKTIGLKAFANCSELVDVCCWSENPPKVQGLYHNLLSPFYNSHVEYATLHVQEASVSAYQASPGWRDFGKIVALASAETGVKSVVHESTTTEAFRYSLDGKVVNLQYKGIQIIKMSDGTIKKVITR